MLVLQALPGTDRSSIILWLRGCRKQLSDRVSLYQYWVVLTRDEV